jgi:hypothetical protein
MGKESDYEVIQRAGPIVDKVFNDLRFGRDEKGALVPYPQRKLIPWWGIGVASVSVLVAFYFIWK